MDSILGLDLGTNSIGWCLLGVDPNTGVPSRVLGMGSRIFTEPTEDKTNQPKNNKRRQKRGERRQRARRKMRHKTLLSLLVKEGFLDSGIMSPGKLEEWYKAAPDPYLLRKIGLDEKIDRAWFARILLHLSRHRGFQSNRKIQKKDEEGDVKAAITSLSLDIRDSQARTLGEYLHGQKDKRRRYTAREMYFEEFDALWASQASFDPEFFTASKRTAIRNTLFFQRPLKIQKHLVGKCSLERNRHRCPKAYLDWQRFRYWQELNHLTIKDPTTFARRLLTDDEKETLSHLLEYKTHLTWKQARKQMCLHDGETFNFEENQKKNLQGNETSAKLYKVLGKVFAGMDDTRKDQLVTDLFTISCPKALESRLAGPIWNFPGEQAAELCDIELPDGYGNLSLKAVRKVLPHLQRGFTYAEAKIEAGYRPGNTVSAGQCFLGVPPDIKNPVVSKALHEVRKVTNALVACFGRPSEVRIELGRDLKQSEKQRSENLSRIKLNEKENNRVRELLEKDFDAFRNRRPTLEDIRKYLLWEESKT